VTLVEIQKAFQDLPQVEPAWPWEKRLLQLILRSEHGIDAYDVLQAVIDKPERVARILPFLCDDDIYKIKALAATVPPSSQYLNDTVDLLNSWAARQTVKKMLREKLNE
jgi:hypothetical protein